MTNELGPENTVCLQNDKAKCNQIWVSSPNGIQLAHFQSFLDESRESKTEVAGVLFDRCARGCLPGGGRPCHSSRPAGDT